MLSRIDFARFGLKSASGFAETEIHNLVIMSVSILLLPFCTEIGHYRRRGFESDSFVSCPGMVRLLSAGKRLSLLEYVSPTKRVTSKVLRKVFCVVLSQTSVLVFLQELALKDTEGFREMAEQWGRVLAVSHAQAGELVTSLGLRKGDVILA